MDQYLLKHENLELLSKNIAVLPDSLEHIRDTWNQLKKKTCPFEICKKLYEMLAKIFPQERVIEPLIVVLKNDENRQKMIEFLESGETDGDRIAYRAVELNRGISLL